MELWEGYFRLWDGLSGDLIAGERQSYLRVDEEGRKKRGNANSYDLCDGLCLEFGA